MELYLSYKLRCLLAKLAGSSQHWCAEKKIHNTVAPLSLLHMGVDFDKVGETCNNLHEGPVSASIAIYIGH